MLASLSSELFLHEAQQMATNYHLSLLKKETNVGRLFTLMKNLQFQFWIRSKSGPVWFLIEEPELVVNFRSSRFIFQRQVLVLVLVSHINKRCKHGQLDKKM
jgi:hypothetical protein